MVNYWFLTGSCIGLLNKQTTEPQLKQIWSNEEEFEEECAVTIEIIDIECVLLSFLSQKFVATKWPIYKSILARPNLLWQGISRGCGE